MWRHSFRGRSHTSPYMFIPWVRPAACRKVWGAQVLDLAMRLSPEGEGGMELSAPSDPLRVTAWHAVDCASGTLQLRFEAFNRLTCDMRNIGVRCAP